MIPITKPKPLIVVAAGGNAFLRRNQPLTIPIERANVKQFSKAVAHLIQQHPDLSICITHGNGPQVGLLSQQDPSTPLDILVAETQGQLGSLLATELDTMNTIKNRSAVTLLTHVYVDPNDPAFHQPPTKHIGRWYTTREEAEQAASQYGWSVGPDSGQYRRVVPSPMPQSIREIQAIRDLVNDDAITVICCGGGGIPIFSPQQGERNEREKQERTASSNETTSSSPSSSFKDVEAVIDKDATSSLLAIQLQAKWLLLLSDEDAVYDPATYPHQKTPLPSPIRAGDVEKLSWPPGSMLPKIKASCRFVRETGGKVGLGNIAHAAEVMSGKCGTVIVP
jgi:carbamate kinase